MTNLRILNLGGGVGSAPIVGMQLDSEVKYDAAIFADTQDEPAWVYQQILWLEKQVADRGGAPIIRVTGGDLMGQLRQGKNRDGGRFISIPAFTKLDDGSVSMIRRQCTREYKIEPVTNYIRREMLGLAKGQKTPKDVVVTQLFGFSVDEAGRAARMRGHERKQWKFGFPLLDEGMRKGECRTYMKKWCTEFEWRWSSCRSCPFHSDIQWREIKENSPDDFEAACRTDDELRVNGNVRNRNMDAQMFLHRSCKPLREVDFSRGQSELFDIICDGGCNS